MDDYQESINSGELLNKLRNNEELTDKELVGFYILTITHTNSMLHFKREEFRTKIKDLVIETDAAPLELKDLAQDFINAGVASLVSMVQYLLENGNIPASITDRELAGMALLDHVEEAMIRSIKVGFRVSRPAVSQSVKAKG